jgi:glycine cleavage system H protein
MYYTDTHEWILVKGSEGIVGVTHYAQEELGAIVHVQLPKVGQEVAMGEEICVLESTKAAADVYAPVSGKISSINEEVIKHPNKINESAEGKGWLFQITVSNVLELKDLLTSSEYKAIVG